jgi:hypothetical protein
LKAFKEVRHHSTSILSGHDPISVYIILNNNTQTSNNKPKRTYFKEKVTILKKKGKKEQLQKAWQLPINLDNVSVRFHVAKLRFFS